jgi:hypothetical protein
LVSTLREFIRGLSPWLFFMGLASCLIKPPAPPAPTPTPPVPTTTTITIPNGPPITTLPRSECSEPQGIAWSGPGPVDTSLGATVNDVLHLLTGCDIGSDCPYKYGAGDFAAQQFNADVIHVLKTLGFCGGQDENGVTDEISVTQHCDTAWAHFHVSNTGGGKVVWYHKEGASCEFDGTRYPCGSARPSWFSKEACK